MRYLMEITEIATLIMDNPLVVVGAVCAVLANIAAILLAYGRFKEKSGQLEQKVSDLDRILHNGMIERLDGISQHLAKLEGKCDLFFGMHCEGKNWPKG